MADWIASGKTISAVTPVYQAYLYYLLLLISESVNLKYLTGKSLSISG